MPQSPRARPGFTLIELLAVVVIISALASLAVARYQRVKEKGYVATMQSDLRNIVTAQEQFFEQNKFYANVAGDLPIILSPGITIRDLSASDTPPSWEVTVSHVDAGMSCTMVMGDTSAVSGLMTCR